MIETSIVVVGMTRLARATDATQTANHATGTGTAEDTRSGTHGEVIMMTRDSTTMADEGGTMGMMIDTEGKTGTTVMTMVDGEWTRAAVKTTNTQADTTKKATTKASGGESTAIEATETVCGTTAIAVSAATSAGVLRGGVRLRLDVHVRILARPRPLGLVHHHHPHHRPPKTRPSPISRRRACSPPRRTRSSTRTERARCSSTMSRLRPASLLSGGGFTFSRAMSKSVRPAAAPPFSRLPRCLLRTHADSVSAQSRVVLGDAVDLLHIHRQSAYLAGRDRTVTDIPLEHPSCSKQHAAIQCTVPCFISSIVL